MKRLPRINRIEPQIQKTGQEICYFHVVCSVLFTGGPVVKTGCWSQGILNWQNVSLKFWTADT